MERYTVWGDCGSGLQAYTKPVQVSRLHESSASTDRIRVKWTAGKGADGSVYACIKYEEIHDPRDNKRLLL